ncbi:MAG: Nramp family divalent metal transporter [Pseudomonadales bacterium]
MTTHAKNKGFLSIIGPGILIAATGVGAGDLATASFSGSQLGVAILWAVLLGGLFKYFLTEGLARWQLVTGHTLLEGLALHFGRAFVLIFLPYLLLWSFFVGTALMSASGVTLHAIFPVFEEAATGKIVFGIAASLIGLFLVRLGGFALFERMMSTCIGVMFFTVMVTAALLWPGTSEILQGIFVPSIPQADASGITWTIALIGGVGGTVTILCYGYWIREQGRTQAEDIKICRIDLATGYAMTILFGFGMVIIGSSVELEGRGAGLLVTLSQQLSDQLGPVGRWLFLIGALGAVFSSLLGVWQAVPYLFADVWRLSIKQQTGDTIVKAPVLTKSAAYRFYQLGLATIPMLGLWVSFKEIQKVYAIIGATFIPLLAVVLLMLNGRRKWLGDYRNQPASVLILSSALIFFAWMAWRQWL